MKHKTTAAAIGVASLIGLTAVAPATAGSSPAVSVEEMLPILSAPQTEADRVPDVAHLSALGEITPESVRLLGSDHAGSYWVGTNENREVCLILQTVSDPESAASSCAPIGTFYRDGLRLLAGKGMDQPERNAEAYLFPADITVPGVDRTDTTSRSAAGEPASEFVSGIPGELDDLDAFGVTRDDGTEFNFAPIPREGL